MRGYSYRVTVRNFCLEKVRKDIYINVNIFSHLLKTVINNVEHPFVITTHTRTFLLRNHLPKVWKFPNQSTSIVGTCCEPDRPQVSCHLTRGLSDPSQVYQLLT